MATPIPGELRSQITSLFREGLNGPQIGARLGLDRSKVNYVLRQELGISRKPVSQKRVRTCARCGKVEEVRADNPALHCRPCGMVVAPIRNRLAHLHTWTEAPCRWCSRVFRIRRCDLESRRKDRRTGKTIPGFRPFCSRECYTEWQKE